MQWYALEHQLKFTASSALPTMVFKDAQGAEIKVDIVEVMKAYQAFRERSHGRKSGA